MEMNNIKFAISIDYQGEQTERVMEICRTMKRILQFSKYDGDIYDYDISAIDNQEV